MGDILRSLKLLVYKEEQGLEEVPFSMHPFLVYVSIFQIGVDHNICPCFCTAIEMIDDENYIASDGRHVFICQKNT